MVWWCSLSFEFEKWHRGVEIYVHDGDGNDVICILCHNLFQEIVLGMIYS